MEYKLSRNSKAPWAKLNWQVPFELIYEEYKKINSEFFVNQRPTDGHHRWLATTLYGYGYNKTKSHWEYRGQKLQKKITKSGLQCPKTLDWVRSLPYHRIDDIRFLTLKAGGTISPHVDVPQMNWLDPVSVAIAWPQSCQFNFTKHGKVPFKTGDAVILNIHYEHSVKNLDCSDRVNLLIHGKKTNEFWQDIIH